VHLDRLNDVVAHSLARAGLDTRRSVFDVRAEARGADVALTGRTTEPGEADGLIAPAAELLGNDGRVIDEIVRLPDADDAQAHGLVTAALAPVYSEPRMPAPQVSQVVLGMRLDILERSGVWLRVRTEDAYIGYVHAGFVRLGDRAWAARWERGSVGEPVVSLGADLIDADGGAICRAPWGARLIRYSPLEYGLPDDRRALIRVGEVVDVDRLADWFPLRGESVARTARRWLGTPYLWGGITPSGADCSGFTQAVLWLHGIALPRDSDMQATTGVAIDPGKDFDALRPGDLLFFADGNGVNHVALSLGGSRIVHSALTNGGVAQSNLSGDDDFDRRLRATFTHARRLLPD
jgi:gamma-D-glutamyl-L-lysine dipeptidyl-peptidase